MAIPADTRGILHKTPHPAPGHHRLKLSLIRRTPGKSEASSSQKHRAANNGMAL
jgi:hypothetical protein